MLGQVQQFPTGGTTITLSTTAAVTKDIRYDGSYKFGDVWLVVEARTATAATVTITIVGLFPDAVTKVLTVPTNATALACGAPDQSTPHLFVVDISKLYSDSGTKDNCMSPFGYQVSLTGTGADADICDVSIWAG